MMTDFILMNDFLFKALLAGSGVAILAGCLGAFMVWQKMAYFGDSLAHSGLLGITFAIAFQLNITLGVAIVAIVMAMALNTLNKSMLVSKDTLLGILSHGALAIGLLMLGMIKGRPVNILGFLYGDILAVSWQDIIVIYAGGLCILGVYLYIYSDLLRLTLHQELAAVEGVDVHRIQLVYLLLLALLIAFAIKIVGVLLITAMLIIPAAASRPFANTPEKMVLGAVFFGLLSVIIGLCLSFSFENCPAGPAIVCVSVGFFLMSRFKQAGI